VIVVEHNLDVERGFRSGRPDKIGMSGTSGSSAQP
jgi:hypothetical protein